MALCISRVHDEESNKFIKELNERFAAKGYRLFVYGICSDLYWNTPYEAGEASVFDLINYKVVDALIIYEEKIKNKTVIQNIVDKAHEGKVPVITIGEKFKGCINVRFAYETGFEQTVRHVIEEHGLTKLHFMGGMKNNSFSEERLNAFKKVLAEKGLSFDEGMVSYGEFWSGPTITAMEQLIAGGNIPEAIICANDVMAITVCDVLKNHGFSIPGDVIVTGFDGVDEINFSSPKITSCFCDYADLAEEIVKILPECLEGEMDEGSHFVTPRMILSESCGCVTDSAINVSEYLTDLNERLYMIREGNRSLTETSSKIQTCENIEQVSSKFDNYMITDLCCLIRKDCTDERINPLTDFAEDPFGETMCLLFDTDGEKPFIPRDFNISEIVPGMEKLLAKKVPLIFVALNFQQIPLGYICFHFDDYKRKKYDRISLTVNAMNNAIGGYRNMRYQHFLTGQIEDMYKTDALTGLFNRTGFLKEYAKIRKRIGEQEENLTIVLADLDNLKYINDHFGHGEGDNAIHTVAVALKNSCPRDAVCVRFGGDEMIAVYEGILDENDIRHAMENCLMQYNKESGKKYLVSASVGVYRAEPDDNLDFEELMRKADRLMYDDKLRKKGKIRDESIDGSNGLE
ncbi:MAG: diguanylate cyclase [Suilimivivens sp.]